MKYTRTKQAGGMRYDARAGILYVGAEDNGEGWWNWWVALDEQGPAAGDNAIVASGGCPTLTGAKERIECECEIIYLSIRIALKES